MNQPSRESSTAATAPAPEGKTDSVPQKTAHTFTAQPIKANTIVILPITFINFFENDSYDFEVYLDVYKNTNKIYSRSRSPFFDGKNSWKDALNFLIKRTPIYTR